VAIPTTVDLRAVLDMVVRMEQRGAAYYRKAAAAVAEEETRQLLEDLAAMEGSHERAVTLGRLLRAVLEPA